MTTLRFAVATCAFGSVVLLSTACAQNTAAPTTSTGVPKTVLPSMRAPAPLSPDLLNVRVAGSAFYVIDLERERAWYESTLGMKAARAYERDGAVFEYIMTAPGGGGVLALITTGQRAPGNNMNSRLILEVPNARALADQLYARGVTTRVAVPGMAYMVMDPEGNLVELYTAPPAAAAPASAAR